MIPGYVEPPPPPPVSQECFSYINYTYCFHLQGLFSNFFPNKIVCQKDISVICRSKPRGYLSHSDKFIYNICVDSPSPQPDPPIEDEDEEEEEPPPRPPKIQYLNLYKKKKSQGTHTHTRTHTRTHTPTQEASL